MRTRPLVSTSVTALFGTLAAVGCVSPEKYNALKLERDGLNEQLDQAQLAVKTSEQKAASYKTQLDLMNQSGASQTGLTANLQQQLASLQAQNADLTAKYNEAIARIGQGPALPPTLTNALTQFADANPNLVEFNAQTGVVKFKSDVTFASGDATLTETAKEAIGKFAQILNSPVARGYELMVAGHADNQPVTAGTAAKGHKDNWYLSAHRAISVAQALQKQGTQARRIGAVGYGDTRPVELGDTREARAKNRRVEVLILPTQVTDAPAPQVSAAPAAEPARAELQPRTPVAEPENK